MTRERGDQDEQAAAGEMEVGQQHINAPKCMPWFEVEGRFTREWLEFTGGRGGFQGPGRRRADRDDSAPGVASRSRRGGGSVAQFGPLRVQDVLVDLIYFDRPKRTKPDMQSNVRHLYPSLRQALEYALREVQSRGGSGDSTGTRRIAGLITEPVFERFSASADVRRER